MSTVFRMDLFSTVRVDISAEVRTCVPLNKNVQRGSKKSSVFGLVSK